MPDSLSSKLIECPACHARANTEPAEGVPDQLSRICGNCGHVFLIDAVATPMHDDRRRDLARRDLSARCENCRTLGLKSEMVRDNFDYFCNEDCKAEAWQTKQW
jgi:hypothetical protein